MIMTRLLFVPCALLALVAGSPIALAFDGDSGGTFLGGTGAGESATWYGGTAVSRTQTTATAFWTTDTAYTRCTGAIALGTPPALGKKWDFSLGVHAPGSAVSCASAVTNLTYTPLCEISDSNKSCIFDVAVSIPAASCMQIKATAVNSPYNTSGLIYAMSCTDANGDANAVFGSGGTTSAVAQRYLGHTDGLTTNPGTFWIARENYLTATGGVRLNAAPGNAKSWALKLQYSTAALTDTQSCQDLIYITTDDLCETPLSGASTLWCSFHDVPVNIPQGGCFRYTIVPAGGPNGTGGQQWNLELSTSSESPYNGGGPIFWGSRATNPGAVYGGLIGELYASNEPTGYWPVGNTPLSTCSGSVVLDTASASNAGLSFPVTIRYATSALAASQSCGDASPTVFETAPLCTITGSATSRGSCTFSGMSVPAAANGCLGITVAGPGGKPTGSLWWSLACAVALMPPTPTTTPPPSPPTPTNAPPATPTPTYECLTVGTSCNDGQGTCCRDVNGTPVCE